MVWCSPRGVVSVQKYRDYYFRHKKECCLLFCRLPIFLFICDHKKSTQGSSTWIFLWSLANYKSVSYKNQPIFSMPCSGKTLTAMHTGLFIGVVVYKSRQERNWRPRLRRGSIKHKCTCFSIFEKKIIF